MAGWDGKCKQEVKAIQQERILTPNALASFFIWETGSASEVDLIRQLEKAIYRVAVML